MCLLVLGWDTETCLGYVKLLRHSEGGLLEEREVVPLLDYLFAQGSKATYNVFWNVRYDFGSLVKTWVVAESPRLKANHLQATRLKKEIGLLRAKHLLEPWSIEDAVREVNALQEVEDLESVEHFTIGPYRILYIPKKGFRLTRIERRRGKGQKNSVVFFDAMSWFATGIGEAAGLDRTAREFLKGEHKSAEEEGIEVARIGDTPGYYEAHREAIQRYCLQDCDLTARLFELTLRGFQELGLPFPKQPWSRASVGRELLKVGAAALDMAAGVLETTRERYDQLARSGHARLWEKAYAGACILTRGVGSWEDVSKWDLNSAYPAPMPDFPSLEGAYLVGRDSPEFDTAPFRFYEVELVPTPRRALRSTELGGDNLVYHQGGEARRAFVTHLDLEAFDLWGDPYVVLDAVGVVCPSPERPLAYMRTLYRLKSEVKDRYGADSVEYLNIKTVLNGTYGILTQSQPRAGRYTNYIYGAYITAWTRRQLWAKALDLERMGGTVLSFMTDGLLVSGLTALPESSRDLGAWEVQWKGATVLFANGLYWLPKDATPRWDGLKRRGAPDLTVAAMRAATRPWVHLQRSGPLGLKQAIIQGRPEDLNVFELQEKDLCPARMLEDAGLRMVPTLRSAPLKAYFTDSWFLEYRRADEPHLAPRVLARTVLAE